MKKFIVTIIIIGIIAAILTTVVVFATRNTEEKSLTTKAEEQIRYLEDKIIAMTNHLNQIRFSNSILVEKNADKDSNNQKQNEQSNETSSEEGSQKGENSEQGSSGGSSSQSSQSPQNEQQSSSSENSVQYEIKNNSILSNTNTRVDWEYMKTNAEIIYSTWPSMIVDLHELNVKNEDILNFSSALDQVTLATKQEDKSVTLNNLASLYGFLPNYRGQISENNDEINIDYTKACLLNSYALVEQDQWEEVKKQLENANTYFSNIMNSINGNGQKQSHISKIYVVLNELNKTIDYKDKQLFYIKYRNAMEELVNF